MKKTPKILLQIFLFLFAIAATFFITASQLSASVQSSSDPIDQKKNEILRYLDTYYVGEYDETAMADAAAEAIVSAGTDPWSFYLSADEAGEYEQEMSNSYVGIGVTIETDEQQRGVIVSTVTKNSPAAQADIRVGDIITAINGESAAELGVSGAQDVVRGEAGQPVELTILREKEILNISVVRGVIENEVASLEMLNPKVAYITIENFDDRSAEETLGCIRKAVANGAEGIIFDVRFNGGGYMDNLVDILDELLPKGDIITAVDYSGREEKYTSDAACIRLPMVVLVNEHSYSAAEFFAAALQEYGCAKIVGTATTGKGYFQNSFTLSDGSVLNLSVGKYYTPQGNSLAETGITPDEEVSLSEEQMYMLYYDALEKKDDAQLQKAFALLWEEIT